ncbi:MAG: tetratricopeptide repeat protein [Chlorobiaceae bacterium]|jgi:tetratricopeptide (TPR) repeat protein|nr:tetratricopeptide repeat protein [Chlorobiaceae bacterium]NTW62731.1 tetratricopeptide repeat protein [Chlorobiaceae bacterium]
MPEIDELESALREDPLNTQKLYDLAMAYLDLQRNSEAVDILDRLVAERRRDGHAFYARGVALLSMSSYRKAGCDFLRTLVLDPAFLPAYKHLGFIQLTLGKEEAAMKTLKKALELDPDCADLYCVLGDVYLDIGEPDKAKEAFEKAFELEPQNAEPHCKLAMYHLSKGDMKGLRREYEILKDLDSDMAEQIGSLFFENI